VSDDPQGEIEEDNGGDLEFFVALGANVQEGADQGCSGQAKRSVENMTVNDLLEAADEGGAQLAKRSVEKRTVNDLLAQLPLFEPVLPEESAGNNSACEPLFSPSSVHDDGQIPGLPRLGDDSGSEFESFEAMLIHGVLLCVGVGWLHG
jgi:hypothetical protein